MSLIGTILIGFFVGLLARFIKPGNDRAGFIVTTIIGIVGAFLGSFLGRSLGMYGEGEPAGLVMSVIGAILVLVIYQAVAKKA